MRIVAAVHDLSLAFLIGGVAGVGLAVSVLFARAPTREIAGQIGNAIFTRLGPAVLALALILLACRVHLNRSEPPSSARSASLALAILIALIASALALWLTPRMTGLWRSGAHAPDGTGLTGEDRARFLALHVGSNLSYLAILILGAILAALRAKGRTGP